MALTVNGHLPITEEIFNELHIHYMNKGIIWFISPKDYEDYKKKLSEGPYVRKPPSLIENTSEPNIPKNLNIKRPYLKLEHFTPSVVNIPISKVNRKTSLSISSSSGINFSSNPKLRWGYGVIKTAEADGRLVSDEATLYTRAIGTIGNDIKNLKSPNPKIRAGVDTRNTIKQLGPNGAYVVNNRLRKW